MQEKKPTSSENLLFEANLSNLVGRFGDPGAIRTRDVPLRRRTLYPAEVRDQVLINQGFPGFSDLLPGRFC